MDWERTDSLDTPSIYEIITLASRLVLLSLLGQSTLLSAVSKYRMPSEPFILLDTQLTPAQTCTCTHNVWNVSDVKYQNWKTD
jgi:hypothetical protein